MVSKIMIVIGAILLPFSIIMFSWRGHDSSLDQFLSKAIMLGFFLLLSGIYLYLPTRNRGTWDEESLSQR
ncbi:MAG: hypothetical protein WC763_00405 [Candidatus Paceibacterota bacterium]